MAPFSRRSLLLATVLWIAVAPAGGEGSDDPDPLGSVQVYQTLEAARAEAFPEAARFERRVLPVTAELKARAAERGARPFAADSAAVYIARDAAGQVLGYSVTGNEIGKYRYITFHVAVDPDLSVRRVAVLVFRESRGAEVHRRRFLAQYGGKDATDPIGINRDIINITGATLSVRALNAGVRKALLLLEDRGEGNLARRD